MIRKNITILQCPLRREIKNAVPEYYMPQVQVLLEITNLELAHFVQYRPEGTWNAQEFVVTPVPRNREWFARHLPRMASFHRLLTRYLDRDVIPTSASDCEDDGMDDECLVIE